MKRYLEVLFGLTIIASIMFASSCKRTEVEGCVGCCEVAPQKLTFENDSTGEVYNFQFPNAFTPINYPHCYYEERRIGKSTYYDSIPGTCRPNSDADYNEGSANLNDLFLIKNYSPAIVKAGGYRAQLRIMSVNDTTPMWDSGRETYGDNNKWFDGRMIVDDGLYEIEQKPLQTGPYNYSFYVYDTLWSRGAEFVGPMDTMSQDDIDFMMLFAFDQYLELEQEQQAAYDQFMIDYPVTATEFLLDSVSGVFCIIRNDYDCSLNNCEGLDPGDALLQQ